MKHVKWRCWRGCWSQRCKGRWRSGTEGQKLLAAQPSNSWQLQAVKGGGGILRDDLWLVLRPTEPNGFTPSYVEACTRSSTPCDSRLVTHSSVWSVARRGEERRASRRTGGQAHQQQLVFEWMRSTSSILWPVILAISQLDADACAHLRIREEGREGWARQCGGVDVFLNLLVSTCSCTHLVITHTVHHYFVPYGRF